MINIRQFLKFVFLKLLAGVVYKKVLLFNKYIKIVALFLVMLPHFTAIASAEYSVAAKPPITLQDISLDKCIDASDKQMLTNGWYLWEPYQFNRITSGGYTLTGMDIELGKAISERVGVEIKYDPITWSRHQRELKEGKRDMAAGATYTEERSQFVYFSIPYRFEENSLFVLKNTEKKLVFYNISEYLAQIRLQNFRLGVTKSFIYADAKINEFIADNANSDILFQYENDTEALRALLRGEIDGFMADRVVGAAIVLNRGAGDKVRELQLNIKTPIHFMFSKQTVPLELVDHFNQEIQKFVISPEYKNIVKNYVYPVLLLQTIDSQWFYMVGMIGTIAFAISGIAIAAKENLTLFGTFLLAMLPSVGGGIMRDVIVNRETVGIILTPSYMYYILIIVVIGFATVRLLNYYNNNSAADNFIQKFWTNLLIVCDAMGQAAMIVIGVSVVIMMRIEPVELWGPFFAFLTSNGGGILRDLLRQDRIISCISGGFNAEVAILWGLVFSIFLDMNAHNPNPDTIRYMVILIASGAFITKLAIHYLNIPNVRFHTES
ncbi:transporter substrate-binding domain-containing protein [Candidatus Trichorickettsia mobilis]|uniref:transporter substrate-binding domain-containing protein n=1 Tax=Candidatus Trichorickettsia mobilis TaxID=1346319 RepID=UPI00292F06C0|nr:transporter substrate-binding domain-containing protein [Candidatus Trichorickettsia mobilis]